jgi:tRNA/tmRNA/rRNA uracil-C5-methylase (TrmA/RlmC/RlmD family)
VILDVGPVAHGGHCVSRSPDGRVAFVRHTLPGERVEAEVTEERRGYLRADAVRVLEPSPDRVPAPCPYARPGLCGGCDFQHATPAAQLALKGDVVRDQLRRLAGLDVDVAVRPLPGGPLGWRSRVQYTADGDGRLGFHRYRSHDVVPVDRCPIAHPAIQELPLTGSRWPVGAVVEAVASTGGDLTVLVRRSRASRRFEVESGPARVRELAAGHEWTVDAAGFWQVHPAAADTFAAAVVELLSPEPGERAFDLYGGTGVFAAALVAHGAHATVVEADRRAVAAGRRALAGAVRFAPGDVLEVLARPGFRSADLVVLDPPRAGAGRDVVRRVAAARPRAVAYVACDPAAFARDVATFGELGYTLAGVRGYDAFPMTHHVETVGLLHPRAGS